MYIQPMIMSMQATNLAYASTNRMFGAQQGIMDLANNVTGAESPADIARTQQLEKALMFAGIQAQTNLQVAWAMQESAAEMRKKNLQFAQRMRDAGALFF